MAHEIPSSRPSKTPAERPPVNRLALGLAASAIALLVGSLTPWITVFGIGISGVSIHYGIVSMGAAALLGLLAYLTTRSTTPRVRRVTASSAALGSALSAASAVYVGWAIRSSFADTADTTDEFSRSLAAALKAGIGVGLWIVLIVGLLSVAMTLPIALQRAVSSRLTIALMAALALITVGGVIGADQKARADERQAAAAAKAKADAQARAEAEQQAEQDRLTAEAEGAEREDRERYKLTYSGCVSTQFGDTVAKGKLTNQSSKARTYKILVDMSNSSGVRFEEAEDWIFDLPPGAVASWEASSFADDIQGCDEPRVLVDQY